MEIKLQNTERQLEITMGQNERFQEQVNDSMAKADNAERDLRTQKEILKQYEQSKKTLIQRLRHELDTVEERFLKVINENNMVGEDYRARAQVNWERLCESREKI